MDWNAITGASTGLLVLVTGYYAYLTHRLTRDNIRSNEFHREAFERQYRMSVFPHLYCSAHYEAEEAHLVIHNAGERAAFDVDVIAISTVANKRLDPQHFAALYVEPNGRSRANRVAANLVDGEFYGVFDHFVYSVFGPRRKVTVPLLRDLPVDSVHLLLQMRDGSGNNYGHYYWFIESSRAGERFSLAGVDPAVPTHTPRVSYDGDLQLSSESGTVPVEFLEFARLFGASFASGTTMAGRVGVEDPGEWASG